MEESALSINRSIRARGGPDNWTLNGALEDRSRVGHFREQMIAQVKSWSSPELTDARRRIEHAIALHEDTCDYLDSIIARLKG